MCLVQRIPAFPGRRENLDEHPDAPFTLKMLQSLFPDFKAVLFRLVYHWVCILGYLSLVEQDGLEKPHFTPVEDIPLLEPPDEEYPFTLTTGSLYYQWHSGTMTRRSATLNREYPEVFAAVNPKDAEQIEIKDGERIRVLSRRGEIETAALLTDMVQEKTIFIPLHYKETAAKVLINPSILDNAKVPELLCAVRIEKL